MFDVIWTDPDRELLGEHRAKKERRRDQKDKDGHNSSKSNKRSSLSTKRSSLSSGGDSSPFSFLRSHGLRRINTSDANSKPRSSASSRLASPSVSSARSPNSTSFDTRSRPSSGLAATCSSEEPQPTSGKSLTHMGRGTQDNQSPGISLHDSVISRNSESDIAPSCSCGAASNDGTADFNQRHQSHPSKPAGFTTVLSQLTHTATGSLSRNTYENATWPRSSKRLPPPIAFPNSGSSSSPVVLVPGPLPPIYPLRLPKDHNSETRTSTDLLSSSLSNQSRRSALLAEMLAKRDARSLGLNSALDIKAWRDEVERMSATNLTEVVPRLKILFESDPDSLSGAEQDAEGIRWMLWALDHLDPVPAVDHGPANDMDSPGDVIERVLMLHESQDIAAYQLATHPTKELHHLSTHLMAPSFATNLRNIHTTSTSPSDFPTSATDFDRVISLSLPSILPVDDISPMLSHLHSCLRSNGIFRLLIIDPTPVVGTSGPRLRAWLRDHLLTNLETASRCSYPSRFFPKWLADASLRGHGSIITTTKFYAVTSSVHSQSPTSKEERALEEDAPSQELLDERLTKAEARCLIGRLLWKHIWGCFVTGEKWWWEDPECVRECLEMGTVWEYHMIEAVKDEGLKEDVIAQEKATEG